MASKTAGNLDFTDFAAMSSILISHFKNDFSSFFGWYFDKSKIKRI